MSFIILCITKKKIKMGVIIKGIMFAVKVLAGIGLGELADKFFSDKLPAGVAPVSPFQSNVQKILKFAALMVVGFAIIYYVVRKLKIRALY